LIVTDHPGRLSCSSFFTLLKPTQTAAGKAGRTHRCQGQS
jgi:hypothetical protein